MKAASDEVKPVKNGKHGIAITETKPDVAPPVAQNPFSFLRRVTDDFERQLAAWGIESPWFDRPLGSWLMPKLSIGQAMWAPEVEIEHRDGKLVVRADVPGARKEDLSIEVLDDRLVLNGERRTEKKEEREGYFHSERTYGSFNRVIPLPPGVKADSVNAALKDGVLEITMDAPDEKKKGTTIEIKS